MTLTRLGPHVLTATPDALTWASRAPIVKQLDGTSSLQAAPPNAVRVFRHFFPSGDTSDPEGTVASVVAALGGYRHPLLFVEVWNESHPTLDQQRRAVAALHAAGLKAAGPSWATGDYTAEDWAEARQAGWDAIAVHCYFGRVGFTIWQAVRYRQFWKPGDPPVLITECGFDDV